MRQKHQIYLISDSTAETLHRMFLAIHSQFSSFDCEKKEIVQQELENPKKLSKKYDWPIIDVTRKSAEETAAPVIKICEIKKKQKL